MSKYQVTLKLYTLPRGEGAIPPPNAILATFPSRTDPLSFYYKRGVWRHQFITNIYDIATVIFQLFNKLAS